MCGDEASSHRSYVYNIPYVAFRLLHIVNYWSFSLMPFPKSCYSLALYGHGDEGKLLLGSSGRILKWSTQERNVFTIKEDGASTWEVYSREALQIDVFGSSGWWHYCRHHHSLLSMVTHQCNHPSGIEIKKWKSNWPENIFGVCR